MSQLANPTGDNAVAGALRQAIANDTAGNDIFSRSWPVGHVAPLSYVQEHMWLLHQLNPDNAACHIDLVIRLKGALLIPVLERSLQEIVRRHTILRTGVTLVNGSPMLREAAGFQLSMKVHHLTAEREHELMHWLHQATQPPFDLEHGPLLRASLYQLSSTEHVLQLVMHHIAVDFGSMGVFLRELAALYTAFSQGQPSPLAELPVQYADYAQWERVSSRDPDVKESLTYWRRMLDGVPPLFLPMNRSLTVVQDIQDTQDAQGIYDSFVQVEPDADLLNSLVRLSQAEGTSLFVLLLAAFEVLLHRYSSQDDFAIGIPIGCYRPQWAQQLIGPFTNILPIRVDLSGQPTFRQLLRRSQAMVAEAYAHQNVGFERLVSELHSARDLRLTQLFQVMCNNVVSPWEELHLPGLICECIAVDRRCSEVDLVLNIPDALHKQPWRLEYNNDLFDGKSASRMLAQFQVLLNAIAINPDAEIAKLPVLPEAERRQVLVEWNATKQDYPHQLCIHHLIETQAERTPEAVAIVYENQQFTYDELNRRANQLAHYLQSLGVGPDSLVGLYAERSLEMIVGLLGILKAGGAYLPLDPAYASERLTFMLSDAHVKLLLTQAKLVSELPKVEGRVVCLDTDWEAIAKHDEQNLLDTAKPENLAYVIYTSGSTGQPKGAQIEHRALVNYIAAAGETFELSPGDRMLQLASIGFDAAAEEIFCSLTRGATLVLRTETMLHSASAFLQTCRDLQLTVLDLPTAYWHALTLQLSQGNSVLPEQVRLVIIGGERALPEPVQAWRKHVSPHVRLLNTYGPTEATIVATMCELSGSAETDTAMSIIPIGRPVANARVYLLDMALQPVPIGAPGEIYIGGDGLARGYLNQPELTAQKFIPDPFNVEHGERLYKTGDLGRYLPDGNIEFLGRLDDQVKVRGFRIELSEVEMVLNQHPSVGQGVVIAWDSGASGNQLAAYVVAVPGHAPTAAALRDYLDSQLPNYMVPATLDLLDSLPLTTNGKIDRKRLPHPGQTASRNAGYAPPHTAMELQLTQIWERVLDLHPIGVNDDFFEIGGHSLAAAYLFMEIESWLGRLLPLATLLQAPTVAQLAAVLQDDQWTPPWSPLVPIQAIGSKPPFFCVHGFGGDVVGYRDLAQLLGPDQPFYGLQARGLNDADPPHTDIREMAADYVSHMRRLQPQGPYYLGGYCYGGVVAFEMARQLADQGERTNFVAVLEGYAVERRQAQREHWKPKVVASFLRNFPYWLRDQANRDGPYTHMLSWAKQRRMRQPVSRQRHLDSPAWKTGAATDVHSRRQRLEMAHEQAMARYQPDFYGGRVTLFRVQAMSLFRSYDPAMGWGQWSGQGVDVQMIAGAHYNILEQPYVVDLAEHLRASLDAAQAKE